MASFVVVRRPGARWNPELAMDEQRGWAARATFVNRLAADGFVILGT